MGKATKYAIGDLTIGASLKVGEVEYWETNDINNLQQHLDDCFHANKGAKKEKNMPVISGIQALRLKCSDPRFNVIAVIPERS